MLCVGWVQGKGRVESGFVEVRLRQKDGEGVGRGREGDELGLWT